MTNLHQRYLPVCPSPKSTTRVRIWLYCTSFCGKPVTHRGVTDSREMKGPLVTPGLPEYYKVIFTRLLSRLPGRAPFPACAAASVCLSACFGALASPGVPDSLVPGRLVDIGGYRLHILCKGEGVPAIILDSGTGGFSLEWARVQEVMARRTQVCSYDRAGYGWSDVGPLPRTSKRISGELHALLEKAGVPGPYILAGHSFGGYTAQLFARNYPAETAGLILIDASHPEQADRFPRAEPRRAPVRRQGARTYSIVQHVLHPNYPDETALLATRIMNSWHHKATWREEMKMFQRSGKQVSESSPMPAVPVTVLTRGRRAWPYNAFGNEMERVWMEMQDELSQLGSDQVHLIAERSGHMIHLDQPGIVISAMLTMINANFPRK